MSKFHSTVTRRDFMKALGLAGAGLGAAAATAPVFHDLDELSSSYTNFKYPWWIKEVDEPTVPLDWSLIDMKLPFSGYKTSVPTSANRKARMGAGMQQGVVGSRLKDYALVRAGTSFDLPRGTFGDWQQTRLYFDIADYDVAPYQGTPEENTHMCRAALHYFGAPRLGITELDPSTNRKLFGSGIQWDADVPKAYQADDGTKVIPRGVKYNLCWPVLQQPQIARCTKEPIEGGPFDGYPPFLGKASTYIGYWDVAVIKYRMRRFLRHLGREGLTLGGLPVAWGPLACAEYCRAVMSCSPEYGMAIRMTDICQTDLALAPTKPIDGGVMKFCETCGRCAEQCPTGSIVIEKGPCKNPGELFEFEGEPINRNPGVLSWRMNWQTCIDYGAPVDCHICQWSCPFNHASDPGLIHPLVAAVAGTTSIFNSFFATMDKQFDYATQMDPDDWWNRNLNTWEHDDIHGRGSGRNV